jgi:hypothetical protein
METETLLVGPQDPATFPCFQSDEHSRFFFLQGRLKYRNLNYTKDFQVVCFLKFFLPKPSTGQLGPLLSRAAKAFDIFFKVFTRVTNLEKLTLLKFEHSRFSSFRDIANRVFSAFFERIPRETFPKTLSPSGFKLDSSKRTHSKTNIALIAPYNVHVTCVIQVRK